MSKNKYCASYFISFFHHHHCFIFLLLSHVFCLFVYLFVLFSPFCLVDIVNIGFSKERIIDKSIKYIGLKINLKRLMHHNSSSTDRYVDTHQRNNFNNTSKDTSFIILHVSLRIFFLPSARLIPNHVRSTRLKSYNEDYQYLQNCES